MEVKMDVFWRGMRRSVPFIVSRPSILSPSRDLPHCLRG
jgi:hypothetical protein